MSAMTEDIRYLKGIGEARAKKFAKLGIVDLQSLISHFPHNYEDRRTVSRIADLEEGSCACIRAIVANTPQVTRVRGNLQLMKLRVVDESGALELVYFNQIYLKDSFHVGETYTFYGRVEGRGRQKQMSNPVFDREGECRTTGRIVPIYPLTAGITQAVLAAAIQQGLSMLTKELRDFLPEHTRSANKLCHQRFAYENIHAPSDEEALSLARRRFAFEELYLLALGLRMLRQQRAEVCVTPCQAVDLSPFLEKLSFSLTNAQRRAVDDVMRDICSGKPMNRLCQGDVGSGKTMVAAAAVYAVVKNGLQAALMAPTEILAEQHYAGLSPLFEALGIRCALLTAALPAAARRDIRKRLAAGEIDLIIGTHSLIGADVVYLRLGLVVTDEQHRFGVGQRAALSEKGENPHLLVMSATPIPRTLALMIYGDLDVSVIDELPPGRQKVETFAVPSHYHPRIYEFIRQRIAEGRQAYIVCPMVEENEMLPANRLAVTTYAQWLRENVFPEYTVQSIHGRMKPKEKEAVMRSFSAGDTHILVATTVVEVGVDVPNAVIMLIENAECFGLSQLHQLRGRVGRGAHKSYCILVSDEKGEENRTRLRAMSQTNNGFEIAEEDLKLRGPGDFFGQRQHGLPQMRVADLRCDMDLLYAAQQTAEAQLAEDPTLSRYPLLRERMEAFLRNSSNSIN